VIGPLPSLRERADRRDAPPDHQQIEGGDPQPRHDSPRRLGATRQHDRHHARPAERQREVNGHCGHQQRRSAPTAGQQDGAGCTGTGKHVVTACKRPRRRRDRRARCADEPGGERVAGQTP
jgi:hypothetical protein